jgi:hypothetical protein
MKSQVRKIAKKKMLSANLEEYVNFLSTLINNGNSTRGRISQS